MTARVETCCTNEEPRTAPVRLRSTAVARAAQRIELQPRHADGPCSVRLRWSMQGPAGAPLLVVTLQVNVSESVSTPSDARAVTA